MTKRLHSRAGRIFLVTVGILLTSTVGHAAARMMAAQMAQGSATFAFELAVMLSALLAAAYVVATAVGRPVESVAVGVPASVSPRMMMQAKTGTASSTLTAAQIAQLRLPPGLRLDSNEGILIADVGEDRRIVFVNPAFARLTGFDAGEWIGCSSDLLLADGPLRMESLLWLDTDENGREAHWIARMHRRDGSPFCAEAHLHPVAPRNGQAGHTVLVMTDVTSRVGKGKPRSVGDAACGGDTRQSA